MAPPGAFCCVVHAVNGFTNQSLRGLVAGLLGVDHSANPMTYDLRRFAFTARIARIAAPTPTLIDEGLRVAVFHTKLRERLLRPLLEANRPPASPAPHHHQQRRR